MITDGYVRSQTAPYDHAEDVSIFSDIATQFRQSMGLDRSVKMKYEVSSIIKVSRCSSNGSGQCIVAVQLEKN